MASTSARYLAIYLAEISYSNLRPVLEKWACPKKLTIGYTSLIKMMKYVAGVHFKLLFLQPMCSIKIVVLSTILQVLYKMII